MIVRLDGHWRCEACLPLPCTATGRMPCSFRDATGGAGVPFDSAQGRLFDSAQGRLFDSAQGRLFDSVCLAHRETNYAQDDNSGIR